MTLLLARKELNESLNTLNKMRDFILSENKFVDEMPRIYEFIGVLMSFASLDEDEFMYYLSDMGQIIERIKEYIEIVCSYMELT